MIYVQSSPYLDSLINHSLPKYRCQIVNIPQRPDGLKGGGGAGGVQGKFFWRIRFELWPAQVPLIIGETFGEVLGPRRPTVSELRPAQKLGVK